MIARDFLDIARSLVPEGRGRPRQADLRRAVSTTYYAVFHRLAQCCADRLVGTGPARQTPAWKRVYRALSHDDCPRARGDLEMICLDRGVRTLVVTCTELKVLRHAADYDPGARFAKSGVLKEIEKAVTTMDRFENTESGDQRALATILLFRRRKA